MFALTANSHRAVTAVPTASMGPAEGAGAAEAAGELSLSVALIRFAATLDSFSPSS